MTARCDSGGRERILQKATCWWMKWAIRMISAGQKWFLVQRRIHAKTKRLFRMKCDAALAATVTIAASLEKSWIRYPIWERRRRILQRCYRYALVKRESIEHNRTSKLLARQC